MIVTSIQEITKTRSRVYIDEDPAFVLYRGEIRILKLKEGCEISQQIYDNIMNKVLPKRAKLRAMNMLKTKRYTRYQLKKKLLDGGYPENVAEEAVHYVETYHYIDDRIYVEDFVTEQSNQSSKNEIIRKLLLKGIDKGLIDDIIASRYANESAGNILEHADEKRLIIKLLRKKNYTGNEDYETTQKLLSYFYRRGFDMDAVRRAMEQYLT